ncbi:uncharacterized protein METZ01_LOCUS175501, partial [marine metagenome]
VQVKSSESSPARVQVFESPVSVSVIAMLVSTAVVPSLMFGVVSEDE